MGVCINIIRNEHNHWNEMITDEDIDRILARYKEHVTFWNVRIDGIQSELEVFAEAVGRHPYDIFNRFNNLQPKRIPAIFIFRHATIRKEVVVPNPNNPNFPTTKWDAFTTDELQTIANSFGFGVRVTVTPQIPNWNCLVDGSFTKEQLQAALDAAAPSRWPNVSPYGSQLIRYVIANTWF